MTLSQLKNGIETLIKRNGDLDVYLYCDGKAYEADSLEVGIFSETPKNIDALVTCRICGYRESED